MALFGLLVIVLVPACVVGVAIGVLLVATARPDASLPAEVAAARRHSILVSALATASGGIALVVLLASRSLLASSDLQANRVLAALPLVAAAVAMLVLWAGELTWPRSTGTVRTALLHDRSATTLAAGRWPRAALLVGVALLATCVVTGLLADPDGRTLSWSSPGRSASASPFPGWFYGLPQLTALLCCAALTTAVVAAAARRPAVLTADVATDDLLRRASTARACRVLVWAALLTLAGDLATAGSRTLGVFDSGPAHVAGVLALAVGLLTLPAAFAVVALPVPRLPRAAARQERVRA